MSPAPAGHQKPGQPGRTAGGEGVAQPEAFRDEAGLARHESEGWLVVVDVDLEKIFDWVNYDVLMDRLSRRIEDKAVLRLIRRYLEAGVMGNGVVMVRYEGTPQSRPLSPLLGNMLLDEVDWELERRGHRFVRYADDCNVYVRSQQAGERVLNGLRKLYERLYLKVNETKTRGNECFWLQVSRLLPVALGWGRG